MTIGRVSEGAPEPLGVTLTGDGANVAVWSADASAIEFCMFDAEDRETHRLALPGRIGPVFHGHVAGLAEGARYGLRAHGPFEPAHGHRFDATKLLLDPWALRIDRAFRLHPTMFERGADSAPAMPKAVLTRGTLTGPTTPAIFVPWAETVIYELHVRGFTRTHPDIPEGIRGTFAALAHPAAIAHLKALGVTTVELMPAAAWIDERHLPPLGLTNAWGYNPVALMAPDPRLAPGGWAEVRAAVDALARAGLETILDVVLNHTGEGDALGPTLSLRGLDNAAYYRLDPTDPAAYLNDAGTGNTLALNDGPALRLAMDALRAWRRLGGVAGFRFDLATMLGRTAEGFDTRAPLLAAIDQDPELRGLKLIAEPWDVGPGGYRLGAFPSSWAEWNDQFRDRVRGFWRGDGVSLGEFARRFCGSRDIFGARAPSRGVNHVVAHDGFTLADLVSYAERRNLANGEQGRDGASDNRSWNHGADGPTDDPAIRVARLADQRALLAILLLARGTPMLAMGSELGRTQEGNNNAYAQDNPLGWVDWAGADGALAAFTGRLARLRHDHAALRADRFLTGAPGMDQPWPDVEWRTAEGGAMTAATWDNPAGETLVMVLAEPAPGGLDRVAIAIHRGARPVTAEAPEPRDGFVWRVAADSADPDRQADLGGDPFALAPRSVTVLTETPASGRRPAGVSDTALARLAAAAGIAPDWSGIDGARHVVAPETQAALLAAMGIPAATTQQALESLAGLGRDNDRRPLPLTVTARPGETGLVRVPVEGAVLPGGWLIIEGEDGETRRVRLGGDEGNARWAPGRDGRMAATLDVALPPLPAGYHTLRREDAPDTHCRLIVAPRACHRPRALAEGDRLWGLSAQIYALRRSGDQGIGDLTTLGELGAAAARRGASLLAINPLHALFEQDRERASPYYPSDRRFVDPIYLDLERVPHAGATLGPTTDDRRAVDYPAVWAVKARALEASFTSDKADPAFAAFVEASGESLRRFALFQALSEAFPGRYWRDWPESLRRPNTDEAAAFSREHASRLRFHQYAQWLCGRQLADAAERARGLTLGLCRDLAVGAAPDGAEIWAQADLVTRGVSIGAPPDPFGPTGQVWGLPPFDPHRLRGEGYRSVGELFAANMRHAGALRIDHVMGLARQFWVPDGAEGADGAYVAFPLEDLLAVLALESERARCLVIGEDLGTVPAGLRERLAEARALSYRVLPFERDGESLRPPATWPVQALACVATHDLPPLAGWWEGRDIAERLELALIGIGEARDAREERAKDRAALLEALDQAGLVTASADADGPLTDTLAAAIHAFVAATNAELAVAQVEDLAGEHEAVNLPGTDRERPNWRRRIAVPLEHLFETSPAPGIVDALRAARPPPAHPPDPLTT